MMGGGNGEIVLIMTPDFETTGAKLERVSKEMNNNLDENTKLMGDIAGFKKEVDLLRGEVNRMGEENDRFSANNKKLEEENNKFAENNKKLESQVCRQMLVNFIVSHILPGAITFQILRFLFYAELFVPHFGHLAVGIGIPWYFSI